MTAYSNAQGQPIRLGAELGRGGEATVYDVGGLPRMVAKIYAAPRPLKAEKLRAMLADCEPPSSVCAWPVTTLHNGHGTLPIGYVMPKIEQAFALDSLISPTQRKRDLPTADWGFIVHAARNLADGVAEIHRHGYIIGDLNENNVRVTKKAEIRFIDCDSFQIPTGSRVLRCEVATLLYWPPELQGMQADAIDRTPNHDAFALAVLIFRLLFLGRHPYAGKFLGRGDSPDIPGLIAQHRFAFGARASQLQVAPPPDALRLQQIPGTLGMLFERAFAPDSAHGGRPTATEWVTGLDALAKDLVTCSTFSVHRYPRSAGSCPWCAIEGAAATALFSSPISAEAAPQSAPTGQVDLDKLWRAVAGVAMPTPTAQLLPEPPELKRLEATLPKFEGPQRFLRLVALSWVAAIGYAVLNAGHLETSGTLSGNGIALLAALAVAVLGLVLHALFAVRLARLERASAPARAAVKDVRTAWDLARNEIESVNAEFAALRIKLQQARDEHHTLRPAFDAELEVLSRGARAAQLHAHLQRFPLRGIRLPNVGAGVIRSLEAYGVYTADNIEFDRVRYVKGIGPKRATQLMQWKAQCEASFRFDSRLLPPQAYGALRHKYVVRHEHLVGQLEAGPMQLTALRQRIDSLASDRRLMLQGLIAKAQRAAGTA